MEHKNSKGEIQKTQIVNGIEICAHCFCCHMPDNTK